MAGSAALSEFVNKLPSTEHEVQSYDCHPLVSSNANAGEAPDIMLIVSGSVKFGGEPQARGFSQSFNLKQDPEKPGTYYVDSDCFRQVCLP
jgi:NTF2-related export protein 1/2